jgi:hypothetical protein
VQLTTNGHRPYLDAVAASFGGGIDSAVSDKHYTSGNPQSSFERCYSPAQFVSSEKRVISGSPKEKKVSISYVVLQSDKSLEFRAEPDTDLASGVSKTVVQAGHHAFRLGAFTAERSGILRW